MSMIFTRFPNVQQAHAFAAKVKEDFGLDGQVFEDADRAHEHGCFPWVQEPPVVHVERVIFSEDPTEEIKKRFGLTDQEVSASPDHSAHTNTTVAAEERVISLVEQFGGDFVGT